MFKRKVVLVMIGICLVSFICGTVTVNGESPFKEIWNAITGLQTKTDNLETRVEELENQLMPQGFLTAPAYDSGWLSPSPTIVIQHNLGTKDLFVYILIKQPSGSIYPLVEQAPWLAPYTSENEIWVYCSLPPETNQIRIMLWKILEPKTNTTSFPFFL